MFLVAIGKNTLEMWNCIKELALRIRTSSLYFNTFVASKHLTLTGEILFYHSIKITGNVVKALFNNFCRSLRDKNSKNQ